jgi:hypothetical protein
MQPYSYFRVLHDTNVHTVSNSLTSKIIQEGYLATVQGHIILLSTLTVSDPTFPIWSTAATHRCSNIVKVTGPHAASALHIFQTSSAQNTASNVYFYIRKWNFMYKMWISLWFSTCCFSLVQKLSILDKDHQCEMTWRYLTETTGQRHCKVWTTVGL